jgi:chromosome segregation ATPase
MKLKKVILMGGLVIAGFAFAGSKYFAHVKNNVTAWADKQVSPESEIKHLREKVRGLEQAEKDIKDELATEMVMCDKLTTQVAQLRTKVGEERKAVLAFAEELQSSPAKVSIGKITFNLSEAKRKLKSDALAVASREKTLASLEKTLGHREEATMLLQRELSELQTLKLELTNELDSLEVEYKALKLQAMQNKHFQDDTKWSEVRAGIEKLKEKLQIKKVRVGLDNGHGTVDTAANESIAEIIAPLTGGEGGE